MESRKRLRSRFSTVHPRLGVVCRCVRCFLNSGMFGSRFDGQCVLLVRSLLSGVHRALDVFHKQQRVSSEPTLCNLIETLCQEEITCPVSEAQLLTVKPLVCLFPALFKQNLLSFIHLVHSFLPRATVFHLLDCLSHDSPPNPWVAALVRQLGRTLCPHSGDPLYSPLCSQRLLDLSQRLGGSGEVGGWASCLNGQTVSSSASQSASGLSELGTQRKRKSTFIALESDSEEAGQQSKRMKMDLCGNEGLDAGDQGQTEDTTGILEGASIGVSAEALQPSPDTPCDSLPEHIKVSVLQIKELLENQAEWDLGSTDVFKVLNDCDPPQVEVLCRMLSLPDLPEQTLPKLCSSVLALSPDLSYSTAATLLKSLLLEKVLSLSEPASRCLLSAVTSLCSSYPRPMCHAVIGAVLEDKNIGNPQADLLNRLIENCLDPHYRLVMLQMTFEIQWNEAVLSIIHSLLDSKPDLHEELFAQFTKQLVNQAPQFTKSVKFAKMMLTVLTKYSNHVTAAHRNALSSCLMLNETFLKKPLQAALKRITHT
ncbi:Fanconi anemia group E protein isoform X1 [Sphaeramia orbicularis]|uniref:Fanconi Anaemia group E protein C-terminal domain-containing protein n=1 Tax=Sphaeramia orbicularis TaxID=375764 RepID=A0A673CUT6_9TELE|nr:Fanconi anemia group E protein isoform X1 [Sphaeramia orbicularis]